MTAARDELVDAANTLERAAAQVEAERAARRRLLDALGRAAGSAL